MPQKCAQDTLHIRAHSRARCCSRICSCQQAHSTVSALKHIIDQSIIMGVFLVAGLLAVEPVTAHNQPFLRNAAPQLLRPVRHVIKANIAVTPSNEITPEWLETLETDQDGKKRMSTIDAVGIIAGTAIGGGFLALPAVTAPLGYLPSAFGLLAVWASPSPLLPSWRRPATPWRRRRRRASP